jgi:predicted alpha/beta hydrolase
MGEDLPLGVYRDWKRWCRFPRYFFDDPAMAHVAAQFAQVTTPIIAATALDDRWAPPASRDAFMDGYRGAPWRAVDIDPVQRGLGAIGHMGYFRPRAEPLWREALAWFGEHAAGAPTAGATSGS